MQLAIGADAVVRSAAGDVLLVKREDFRVWTIPGGAAERGETPAQAAVRETEEESGVQVAIDELSGVYAFGPAIGLIFVYTAHPVGGAPRTSRESVDVRFFPPGALPRWMLHFARPRLLDALSGQRGTFRYQPYPLWAKVALPAMLRARRLRNRLQGHPEPPLAYRDVVVQESCAPMARARDHQHRAGSRRTGVGDAAPPGQRGRRAAGDGSGPAGRVRRRSAGGAIRAAGGERWSCMK